MQPKLALGRREGRREKGGRKEKGAGKQLKMGFHQ
jgi:hypothetical protein